MTTMNWTKNKNDEYYTPTKVWNDIDSFLPELCVVYEPFFGQGHTYKYFDKMNYFMLGEADLDFFSAAATQMLKHCDCVITNPAFSIKYDVINRLVKFDVPFIMIFPMGCVTTIKFRTAFNENMNDVSIIVTRRRIKYIKNDELISPNFESCYVCYKMPQIKPIEFL